jgi:flagellar biosynthesis protein FlhF
VPEALPSLGSLADHHGSGGDILRRLRETLAASGNSEPEAALAQALHGLFRFAPLPAVGTAPMLLVGPPGAGKTASVAKLAARAVLAGTTVRVVTADVDRSGGVEQLAALTAPLAWRSGRRRAATRCAASSRKVAKTSCSSTRPGSTHIAPRIGALSGLIETTGGAAVLVLSAGLVAADCEDIAHTFRALGIVRMLPTKLDVARRLGGLLSAADAGLAFTDAGIGPTVGRGFSPLSPSGLARLLLHAQMPRRQSERTGRGGGERCRA